MKTVTVGTLVDLTTGEAEALAGVVLDADTDLDALLGPLAPEDTVDYTGECDGGYATADDMAEGWL